MLGSVFVAALAAAGTPFDAGDIVVAKRGHASDPLSWDVDSNDDTDADLEHEQGTLSSAQKLHAAKSPSNVFKMILNEELSVGKHSLEIDDTQLEMTLKKSIPRGTYVWLPIDVYETLLTKAAYNAAGGSISAGAGSATTPEAEKEEEGKEEDDDLGLGDFMLQHKQGGKKPGKLHIESPDEPENPEDEEDEDAEQGREKPPGFPWNMRSKSKEESEESDASKPEHDGSELAALLVGLQNHKHKDHTHHKKSDHRTVHKKPKDEEKNPDPSGWSTISKRQSELTKLLGRLRALVRAEMADPVRSTSAKTTHDVKLYSLMKTTVGKVDVLISVGTKMLGAAKTTEEQAQIMAAAEWSIQKEMSKMQEKMAALDGEKSNLSLRREDR